MFAKVAGNVELFVRCVDSGFQFSRTLMKLIALFDCAEMKSLNQLGAHI